MAYSNGAKIELWDNLKNTGGKLANFFKSLFKKKVTPA